MRGVYPPHGGWGGDILACFAQVRQRKSDRFQLRGMRARNTMLYTSLKHALSQRQSAIDSNPVRPRITHHPWDTSRRVTTGFHVTCHARGGIRISFHTATTQVLVTMPTYFTKKSLSPAGQLGIQQSGHTSKIDHNPSRPAPQFQPPSARARLCPLQPRARPWQRPTRQVHRIGCFVHREQEWVPTHRDPQSLVGLHVHTGHLGCLEHVAVLQIVKGTTLATPKSGRLE